jgi:hypothetical protein
MPGPARLRAILPKDQISAKYPPARIQKWFKDVGEEFRKEMKVYPPPFPGSSYQRTGKLRSGWDSPLIITQASVTLLNNVSYSRWVQGPNVQRATRTGQRKLFKARGWQSQTDVTRKVIQKNIKRLRKIVLPTRFPGA